VKQDDLTSLIKEFLGPQHHDLHSLDEVVLESVAHLMSQMMTISNIPYPMLDLVQEHLMEDAWDIVKKITYGSLNLQDYRDSLSLKQAMKRKKIY
jgi:hypothetical protein